MTFKLNDYNAFLSSLYDKTGDNPNGPLKVKEDNLSPNSMTAPAVKQEFPVDFDFGLAGDGIYKEVIEDNLLGGLDTNLIKQEGRLFQDTPLDISPQLGPASTLVRPDPFFHDVMKNSSISTADTMKTMSPSSEATSPYPEQMSLHEDSTYQQHAAHEDKGLVTRKQSGTTSSNQASGPRGKSSHNVIEQRYRNKINDKFTALQESVPTLRIVAKRKKRLSEDRNARNYEDDDDDEKMTSSDLASSELDNLEGLEPARKLNKGTILAKSIEYIKFLELKNDRMRAEHEALVEKARLMGLSVSQDLLNL